MGKFTCNIWVTKVGEDTDVHSKVSLLQSEKQPVLVKVAVSVCLVKKLYKVCQILPINARA